MNKMLVASLLTLLVGVSAQATPGDVGCAGKLGKDKVEVLIGYDHHGEGPSLLEVSVGGKILISANTVDEKMINKGTEDMPFIVGAIAGIDEVDSTAELYFPEQDGGGNSMDAILSVNITNGLEASDIKIKCEK